MSEKINILDINIDNFTAKEAMKRAVEYMDSDPVSIIEMITVNGLIKINEIPDVKEVIGQFDLVLAGDKEILEAADITDRKSLQETESQVFLKMFLRYLHKNHSRVYLLVESEEEGQEMFNYLERRYSGMQVAGLAKVSAEDRADDMLVNAINGGEVDCIISILSAPLQEDFATKNRGTLNARVWLGAGKEVIPVSRPGIRHSLLSQFFYKRIFKREIEKRKRGVGDHFLPVK